MKLKPEDLERISALTLAHYNERAGDFFEGTRDHDVSQNIAALLEHIEGEPPYTILDFGCGPGRDLKTFSDLGHTAIGLDGAAQFVEMARAYSGCEAWLQDFHKLDLPHERFDGVFANASLFHVAAQELPRVLRDLHATLKPGGVLFSSNPRGRNEEGWNRGRYGAYHDLAAWRSHVSGAGFVELTHYYRPPGLPQEQQPWLASVWRKPAPGAANHSPDALSTMEQDSSVSKKWEAMQLNDPVGTLDRAFADLAFNSKEIVMGLHWDPPEEGVTADAADLDALCVLFDAQGRALETVYPSRTRNANGSVIHTGDSQTGASEWDDESIFAFLDALPEAVAALAFVVVSTTGRAFSEVRGARCHLSDRFTEHAWVRLELTSLDGHAPHCVAALRRGPAGWEISAAADMVNDELMAELQSLVTRGKISANQ